MTNNHQKSITWKFVPGFPEYEVSEHGDVRRGQKLLKPERVQGSGRKRYGLSRDGRRFVIKASQLVALAFIGPAPFDGAEVCHDDSFFHNNHFSNLRWDTHIGNAADVLAHKIRLRDGAGAFVSASLRLRAEANKLISKAARPA